MNKDSRRNFGMGITIFVSIICLVSTLVLLSHLNKVGIGFAQSDSNASKFKAIRDQYLQSWENFGFQSIFDTYVVGGTNRGYGVYEEHVSNLSSVSNASMYQVYLMHQVYQVYLMHQVYQVYLMHQVYQVYLTCRTYPVRILSHPEKRCIYT